jgi:hypothetical protein
MKCMRGGLDCEFSILTSVGVKCTWEANEVCQYQLPLRIPGVLQATSTPVLKDSDIECLQFVYDRFVNVHNEEPDMDYMIHFREILQRLSTEKS